MRGIALIALIDSLVIALGMLVFGTPHGGTLTLLSFVWLFIPILGAWVSGIVIVLVTLGRRRHRRRLAMAAVILVGQQLDSMFVTPLVYQPTVNLHPIVTLTGGHRRLPADGHHRRLPRGPDDRRRLGGLQRARAADTPGAPTPAAAEL